MRDRLRITATGKKGRRHVIYISGETAIDYAQTTLKSGETAERVSDRLTPRNETLCGRVRKKEEERKTVKKEKERGEADEGARKAEVVAG